MKKKISICITRLFNSSLLYQENKITRGIASRHESVACLLRIRTHTHTHTRISRVWIIIYVARSFRYLLSERLTTDNDVIYRSNNPCIGEKEKKKGWEEKRIAITIIDICRLNELVTRCVICISLRFVFSIARHACAAINKSDGNVKLLATRSTDDTNLQASFSERRGQEMTTKFPEKNSL